MRHYPPCPRCSGRIIQSQAISSGSATPNALSSHRIRIPPARRQTVAPGYPRPVALGAGRGPRQARGQRLDPISIDAVASRSAAVSIRLVDSPTTAASLEDSPTTTALSIPVALLSISVRREYPPTAIATLEDSRTVIGGSPRMTSWGYSVRSPVYDTD